MAVTRLLSARLKPKPLLALWPWERSTLPAAEVSPGWLASDRLPALTWLLAGLFIIWLNCTIGWPAALLALPLARLMALDLTTHTLPDIYTIPLITMGLAHAWNYETLGSVTLTLALVTASVALLNYLGHPRKDQSDEPARGFGGGDLKLMLALFAWLPPAHACFAIGVGCLLWLPFGFYQPRWPQPFGVALVMGWLIFAAWPAWGPWVAGMVGPALVTVLR